jgi:hypothetical protein
MGGEASKLQQQESLNNNQQNILDSEHKQKVLTFFKSRIHSMEHQKQPEEFGRPVSSAGGDMYPMNGSVMNGSVSQQKSAEHQKSPQPTDKIPSVAVPEQRPPLPTSNAPSDPQKTASFAENTTSMISSERPRLPSAVSGVVGVECQKPLSTGSDITVGELQRPPSVASSVTAAEVLRPSSASSNVISAELPRPPSAASSTIAAELKEPHSVNQKPELSKVMNGVAVKPSDGMKKGGKDEEDDDNDVVVLSPPDVISSSSNEMVVEGNIQGPAVNEMQAVAKPVIAESKPSDSMKLTTLEDARSSTLKQFKETECVEDKLKKTVDGNKPSGKEEEHKEDKEKESPKKEDVKGEETRKKAAEIVVSPKEPEQLPEKAEVLADERLVKEVAKKEESPETSVDTTSKYAPVQHDKPEEKTLKSNESVLKEMTKKTEVSIEGKSGIENDASTCEKEKDRIEALASKNGQRAKEHEIVAPEKGAEISKKEYVKKGEDNIIELNASSSTGGDKREFPTSEQGKEIGKVGISAAVDTAGINKESQRKEEENKAEDLGGSSMKSTEEIQKDVPVTEKTKVIEMKKEALKNETDETKKSHSAQDMSSKTETGQEDKKLGISSKNKVEIVKREFPVKEKQTEIDRNERSPKKDFKGDKEESLIQERDKLLGKQEVLEKDIGEIKKKNKEDTIIIRKTDSLMEGTEILKNKLPKIEKESEKDESAERKPSTKEREEKSEENFTLKILPAGVNTVSSGNDSKILRPGSESPALSKSTTPKKSRKTSESESDVPVKTRSAPEGTKSTPKKLAVKVASETESEKSPRAKTPKDREEWKLKRKTAKKHGKESPEDVSKKQGKDTETNITHLKACLVCDSSFIGTAFIIRYDMILTFSFMPHRVMNY